MAAGAAYGPSIQLYFAELNRTKWISTATENRKTPCATSTRRGSKIFQILEKGALRSFHLSICNHDKPVKPDSRLVKVIASDYIPNQGCHFHTAM